MGDFNEKLFNVLDILISEYGWSLEYCLKLPGDIVVGLLSAIHKRKFSEAQTWTKLIGAACGAGFAGKLDELDKLFKDTPNIQPSNSIDEAAWKGQVKSLWLRKQTEGKKNISTEDHLELNERFEKLWSEGNIEF